MTKRVKRKKELKKDHHPEKAQIQEGKKQLIFYWFAFGCGLLWIIYLCLKSPGTPVQDEIGHFLISLNSWNYPSLMLDRWGRPFNTILYMIPSIWGLNGARFFSILLACLTILLTTKVAKGLGVKMFFLIPLFLWFQPWFNNLSYTVITEVPFSLFMVLGIYLWLNKQETLASIPIGLLPLIRHEGIAMVGVWCIYMLYKKKFKSCMVTLCPIFLYNLIYFAVFQRWASSNLMAFKPTSFYRSGSLFYFVLPLIKRVGTPLFILSLLSIIPMLKLKEKILAFAFFVLYFLVHTIIYRFGLFASGGYILFLLPLAPAFAIASAMGLEFILELFSNYVKTEKKLNAIKAVVVVICIILVVSIGLQTRPRALDPEGSALQEAANWIHSKGLFTNKVISTHVWFYYFYNLPWIPGKGNSKPPPLDTLDSGAIVVWDSHYSNRFGLSYNKLIDPQNGWKALKVYKKGKIIVFQKT